MNANLFILVCGFVLVDFGHRADCNKIWHDKDIDFIIVGAGASGAALASRLSEDENFGVLLLEAGGEPQVFNDIPYFAPGPFLGEMDWKYFTEPQKYACFSQKDKRALYSRGKGLGGSTLINALVYTRGDPKDYDNWEKIGNEGWGYDDVLPFFKKIEDYRGPMTEDNEQYHNVGGPMTVSPSPFQSNLTQIFLDAGRELGYSEVDYNGKDQRGFSRLAFTLRNGSRCTAYKAYLKDVRSRANLKIVTNALVTKVEFDEENRAIGVIFEHGDKLWSAKAKKEVILSAGTVNTPQILLLSGIGPKNTLEKFKIPIISDLSGVGKHLQDHVVTDTIITLEGEMGFRTSRDVNAENFELLETKGQGPLSVPFRGLGIAFVDSEYVNSSLNWPDIEFVFHQIANFGGKPISQPPGKSTFNLLVILLRPKSIGYITIQSTNPHDPPIIDPNYLSEKEDVDRLISGMKLFQKLVKTKSFQKFGAYWDHDVPAAKGCEQYEFESDDYLECFVRHFSSGIFHPASSCKMGPRTDTEAVVNQRLKVYGVRNLRIVDLSVSPTIISGHPMAASMMIGERAAEFIKEQWRHAYKNEL